jgi:hypothetical protein
MFSGNTWSEIMGIPWREGMLGIDWPEDSPWWDILGDDYDPFLSVKEFKFVKKFNLKKIPEEIWLYDMSIKNCDNCSRTSIRRSTGCPWCYVRGVTPVGPSEVCDLHIKRYHTNAILEHYCYWHWSKWLLKELQQIDRNFEFFKIIN